MLEQPSFYGDTLVYIDQYNGTIKSQLNIKIQYYKNSQNLLILRNTILVAMVTIVDGFGMKGHLHTEKIQTYP